jgi:lipid-A-disaccharide synthase
MPKKIFLIACEPSGDLHGAYLVSELKKLQPSFEFLGLGGSKMKAAGVTLLEDMTTLSALGLGDVIRQYFRYRRIFYAALKKLADWRPHALIVIDSPAFNLRFVKKVRKFNGSLPIFYYISPQIWAWGGRRIHTIKKTISKMLCILPFEISLYQKAGIPCEFVGHPLLDLVKPSASRDELRRKSEITPGQKAIGLLPGSRSSEVRRILPVMLETASYLHEEMPQAIFFLAESPNVGKTTYDEILNRAKVGIRRFENDFYDRLSAMDFALVASGTATLETALVGTPFFLLYKTGWSTYFLGKRLIRVPFLGIVNLLAGEKIVPEFIQEGCHPLTIAHEAKILLENRDFYDEMKREFLAVREKLGAEGASTRAAKAVVESLQKS